jgi:hypothetical protein
MERQTEPPDTGMAHLALHDGYQVESYLEESIRAACSLGWINDRIRAIIALLPHVTEDVRGRLLEECLNSVQQIIPNIGGPVLIGELLDALAPHLPQSHVYRALEIARKGPNWRSVAVLALQLPQSERKKYLCIVLEHTAEFLAEDLPSLMELIAPKMPLSLVPRAWESTTLIADAGIRRRVAAILTKRMYEWACTDPAAATAAWIKGLEKLFTQPRPDVLRGLWDLAPLAAGLDEEVATALLHTILDVSKWWP